jgi:hypothetical protein
MEDHRPMFNLLTFAPLLIVTYQVVMLGRILRSPAWRWITTGFLVFVIVRGSAIVYPNVLGAPSFAFAAFLGYCCLAYGLHRLRDDLYAALSHRPKNRGEE